MRCSSCRSCSIRCLALESSEFILLIDASRLELLTGFIELLAGLGGGTGRGKPDSSAAPLESFSPPALSAWLAFGVVTVR